MRLIEFATPMDEIGVGRDRVLGPIRAAGPADPFGGLRQRVGVVKPFGC